MTKKSSGFTLIEMLVVILIIGILAAYFGQDIFRQTDDARLATAEVTLTHSFPRAILGLKVGQGVKPWAASRTESKYGVNAEYEPAFWNQGINRETPWGIDWVCGAISDDKVVVYYPIKGGEAGKKLANTLQANIQNDTDNGMISNVAIIQIDSSISAGWRNHPGNGAYAVKVTYKPHLSD